MGMNNCNTYFINGSKKILIDPGHQQLIRHVKEGLVDINISIDQIDLVIITHGHPDTWKPLRSSKSPPLLP